MKSPILLLAFAAIAFSSCTSVYKTGQTPDDVYYSPARPQDEYVRVEKNDDRHYQSSDEYYEDRYLHMRVANRYQWSYLDDYYYNSPYAYNYYSYYDSWNNPYNSYWSWNTYYNPYYTGYCHTPYYGGGGIIIKTPSSYYVRPSRPIAFNPASYNGGSTFRSTGSRTSNMNSYFNSSNNNNRYNNSNRRSSGSYYNNSNSGRRSSYSNSGSSRYDNNSSSTPSRSYTPSSSSSSSSSSGRSSGGSSGGSSSGGSRPTR